MRKISRRQFIQLVSFGAGAISINPLLVACGSQEALAPTQEPTADSTAVLTEIPTASQIPTELPTSTAPEATQPVNQDTSSPTPEPTILATTKPKDMVVARGGEPDVLARTAFGALGGMSAFVKAGADVIIKPNICTAYYPYEYAATTNPWLVATLVKMAFEAGAKRVRVMDFPFGGEPKQAYAISGISDQVTQAGGEMEIMSMLKFKDTSFPDGKKIKHWAVYEDILKADVVINVPIAKTHDLAILTLGMKNLMGVILDRGRIHMSMGPMLTDLAMRIKPTVTVIDAIRILTAHGPTGGSLDDVKKLDTLIVSRDIVAADSYAASLFGKKPEDLDYIVSGTAAGLGVSDLSQLNIEEINVGG